MFNSRNPMYRNPVGAVPAGTPVHFKINLSRDLHCSGARLNILDDSTGEKKSWNLFWCGMDGEAHEWWECDWTPPVPGLYFYHFTMDTWRGPLQMMRGLGSEGTFERCDESWQLTAYDPAFQTPDWLAGGVMYQIFPDRFYASGTPKQGVPADRRLHESWLDQPDWKPNEKGEVTNSDYFGGDLLGIEEKLPYLQSLGVTCIYLNPIFESHSNHRYNTANYEKVDPLLGNEEDFRSLCKKAEQAGIRILLDGVFSHTGSDSVYFNRENRYPEKGAYNSKDSVYYPWYSFRSWPKDYECWWGFVTLPNVNELNEQYDAYINGKKGIIQKWIEAGASGWRLDVADELPDGFLDHLRISVKQEDPNALILGEVWEDASTKSAYGKRRKYLLGEELDSVMNYPFCDAVLGFLTGAKAADCLEMILRIVENYPPQVTRLLMNHIGTHDTERALTVLAGEPLRGRGRQWQSEMRLTPEQREKGLRLMRLATVLQYTLPGVPCIYYGDEAGVEGYRDPFNRSGYPWGKEDTKLLAWYRRLGEIRADCHCLREGDLIPHMADGNILLFERRDKTDRLLCAVNRGSQERKIYVYGEWRDAQTLIGEIPGEDNGLLLEPYGCVLLKLLCPEELPASSDDESIQEDVTPAEEPDQKKGFEDDLLKQSEKTP